MSLNNNSANNFKDFLDAIKPFLNYQFYDMSGMGSEALIFDTNEKVVGQWTDGKLIYSKTVDCGQLPNTDEKQVAHNISNIDKVVHLFGYTYNSDKSSQTPMNYAVGGTYNAYSIACYANRSVIGITSGNDRTRNVSSFVTVFYTKTTDSPLASGEKFAGLTASGDVIYKKHLSGSLSISSSSRHMEDILDVASLNIQNYVGDFGVWTDSGNTYKKVGIGDNEYLFSPRYNATSKKITAICLGLGGETISYDFDIYYTKSS